MNDETKRLSNLALSDTGFAFDPCSGSTFSINATGLSVIESLKQGLAPAAAVERLRERFDARGADLLRDVDDFVAMLRQYGLVGSDA